ncbi:glycosyltransferase family 39 protein [Halogeometricum sp. S1BR25-6]|uniref:Glycosyltransferase family 39 protein n=1 Tax=Halogeometricum salsisoli TaxID=2950536 RepID=A0ABU2GDP8_9EURY|nr:glycosyltransferase family 39 protein [Halogeometricum sp. S1BR25-6]MDS0298935.1 glycosyltransferase family 39 protein [Halogeometricum sp. S1BR25-6]
MSDDSTDADGPTTEHPAPSRLRSALSSVDSVDRGRLAALCLALLAAAVALLVAAELFPYRSLNHDEGVYLQQAELLLHGRLFLRPPVEEAFRPWFFVESDRGLYSKYAPVPAAVFALGKALGGYPLALAGVAAGLVAGVVALGRELFDARVGALAGALLLLTPLFVVHSGVYLPYALTTALNVAFAVAYLRGERRGTLRDAAAAGLAVGAAFFSRPYTAVLFALPFVAHAGVTLLGSVRRGRLDRSLLARRLVTAAGGTAGVLAALGYNAVVTGDPLVFPYLAFAPSDGLGFGRRAILGHEVAYTPELGVRANALVLADLFSEWVVAGRVGTVLAALGVALALLGRSVVPGGRVRPGLLAATYLTVAAGNVAFWGNYNVLGALEDGSDGLVHYLGPYYHYDLVVPTAVFAALVLVAAADRFRRGVTARAADRDGRLLDAGRGRAFVALVLVVCAAAGGAVAVSAVDEVADRDAAVTAEYRAAYAPLADEGSTAAGTSLFSSSPPTVGASGEGDAVVFVPTPYGPWLNHPFQTLRNDADYDDGTVYALGDTRELAVAAAFPDRDLHRYVYAGSWVPTDDSTVRAAVVPVSRVSGERAVLDASFDLPEGAESATVRVHADDGSTYLVATDAEGSISLSAAAAPGRLTVSGPGLEPASGSGEEGNASVSLPLTDDDEVFVEVFVETGPASGFSYEVVFPVERIDRPDGEGVRALSPTVERCPVPTRCVPRAVDDSPSGVGVNATLSAVSDGADEPNESADG